MLFTAAFIMTLFLCAVMMTDTVLSSLEGLSSSHVKSYRLNPAEAHFLEIGAQL